MIFIGEVQLFFSSLVVQNIFHTFLYAIVSFQVNLTPFKWENVALGLWEAEQSQKAPKIIMLCICLLCDTLAYIIMFQSHRRDARWMAQAWIAHLTSEEVKSQRKEVISPRLPG